MIDKVKITGIEFEVKPLDKRADKNLMGLMQYDHNIIFIREDLPTDRAYETLMHEVFHVIYKDAALGTDGDEEERIVSAMSAGFYNFLKENPNVFTLSQDLCPVRKRNSKRQIRKRRDVEQS